MVLMMGTRNKGPLILGNSSVGAPDFYKLTSGHALWVMMLCAGGRLRRGRYPAPGLDVIFSKPAAELSTFLASLFGPYEVKSMNPLFYLVRVKSLKLSIPWWLENPGVPKPDLELYS